MRAVFIALVIGLSLCGCRPKRVVIPVPPPPSAGASTLAPGTVIRSAGTWSHSGGGSGYIFTVSLIGKRVDWRHYVSGPGGGGRGNTSGSIDAGVPPAPWFIYVDAPDRLWFCDGAANLSCRTWRAGGGSSVSEAILNGALKENPDLVPAEVVRLLPADLQKLFPEAASKPRPSI